MKTKKLMTLKFGILLTLLLAAFVGRAQNLEIPQKEFSLSFSTYKLELLRGDSSQLDIGVIKSKSYRQNKVKMGISSSVPKGVTIGFSPEKGNFDFTKATVHVDNSAIPGSYFLILNATVSNQTKGSILKLTIKE